MLKKHDRFGIGDAPVENRRQRIVKPHFDDLDVLTLVHMPAPVGNAISGTIGRRKEGQPFGEAPWTHKRRVEMRDLAQTIAEFLLGFPSYRRLGIILVDRR